jgi:hypothetical protein
MGRNSFRKQLSDLARVFDIGFAELEALMKVTNHSVAID